MHVRRHRPKLRRLRVTEADRDPARRPNNCERGSSAPAGLQLPRVRACPASPADPSAPGPGGTGRTQRQFMWRGQESFGIVEVQQAWHNPCLQAVGTHPDPHLHGAG